MKNIFIIIFILMTLVSLGQEDSISTDKIYIKLTPLGLLDFYNGPAFRVGAEFAIKNNFATNIELGTYLPNNFKKYFVPSNVTGALARIEFKIYRREPPDADREYFSSELFYKYQSYETSDSINTNTKYLKDFSVYKNVFCFTLKYGWMDFGRNGFFIENYVGLGVRFKWTSNSLTSVENANIIGYGDYEDNLILNKAGYYITPNIDMGIKVGYIIK